LDENDVRVKDITFKWAKINPDTMGTIRNIVNQAQMKQIFAKLDAIQEFQSYQIDRDRDRDIVTPFLTARNLIVRAQTQGTLEVRENLKKATDEIAKGLNSVYTDLSTTSMHIAKLTSRPIFQNPNQIKTYIGYLTSDLQSAAMYVGVQMHVFDYLGDKASSNLALEDYQHNLRDFFKKSINQKGESAATLIHLYYPYDKTNLNFWYNFAKDMEPVLQADLKSIEGKEIYLVSVDDVRDEDEH
jgi:hypothetical protein